MKYHVMNILDSCSNFLGDEFLILPIFDEYLYENTERRVREEGEPPIRTEEYGYYPMLRYRAEHKYGEMLRATPDLYNKALEGVCLMCLRDWLGRRKPSAFEITFADNIN